MAYESFVGRRYLMAKQRSRVVSIITLIAVGGVALGVTALIVVLSVMGGFTKDLTDKILGARAHIVIQHPDHDPIEQPEAVAEEAMEFDGVVGASPYIESEVMVTSRRNLGAVVLRGVDVDRVQEVSTLLDDIRVGELEYLRDDEELLAELDKPEESSEGMMEMLDGMDRGARDGDGIDFGGGDDEVDPGSDREPADDPAPDFPAPSMESDTVPPPLPGMDDDGGEDTGPGDVAQEDLPPPVNPDPDRDPELPEIESGGGMPPMFEELDGPVTSGIPGIIIGIELANSLQVDLGDEISVVTSRGSIGPTGPIPSSRPHRVVGIFESGMYEYDASHAYTSFEDASRLVDQRGATGVEVRADDVDSAVDVADRMREAMAPRYDVIDWQELNSSLFFALKLERIGMFIVLTFIILVASFSIVAMLIMIVIEKAREIAILKSMGASNGGIMGIFIYQGVVIGVLGAILGLGAGLGICYYLTAVGLPLNSEVYYISRLPVEVNPWEVTAVVVCAIVISFLATLYPSFQAARLNPVKGLRHD